MAVTKTYRAIGSIVDLTMYIDGRNVDISFYPVSNYEAGRGGSRYETSDPVIQQALERRFDFGQLFYLERDGNAEYDNNGAVIEEFAEESSTSERVLETVKVDSIQTAKDYLIEHFGWSPSGRISKSKLEDAAEGYGITFEGLS